MKCLLVSRLNQTQRSERHSYISEWCFLFFWKCSSQSEIELWDCFWNYSHSYLPLVFLCHWAGQTPLYEYKEWKSSTLLYSEPWNRVQPNPCIIIWVISASKVVCLREPLTTQEVKTPGAGKTSAMVPVWPPMVSHQSTLMIHRWYTDDTLTPHDVTRSSHKSWDLHQQLPGHMLAALASSLEV